MTALPCRWGVRVLFVVAALPCAFVTTAVRERYLDVLGFSRSGDLDTPAKESGRNPHTVWSSSDGEWERIDLAVAEPPRSVGGTTTTQADIVAEITTSELDEIWARYKETATQADRDQLIVYYAPLVKYVASRIAAGLPQSVDQADLVSYGMFGLIDAITKFDPCLLYTSPSPRDA